MSLLLPLQPHLTLTATEACVFPDLPPIPSRPSNSHGTQLGRNILPALHTKGKVHVFPFSSLFFLPLSADAASVCLSQMRDSDYHGNLSPPPPVPIPHLSCPHQPPAGDPHFDPPCPHPPHDPTRGHTSRQMGHLSLGYTPPSQSPATTPLNSVIV